MCCNVLSAVVISFNRPKFIFLVSPPIPPHYVIVVKPTAARTWMKHPRYAMIIPLSPGDIDPGGLIPIQ